MDKLLLKLVRLFKALLTAQGIDFERMMTIVETKLTMDKRRVYMNWKQRQQKKENANHLTGVLFFYLLMGAFIGAFLFAFPSVVLCMIMLHSYVLFMMAMTLITDFSTVLLDTTDNQVILPKPVSSKTLFMARLVHILVYLLQFTIAIASLPVAVSFYKYGAIAGTVLIFTVLLTVLMAVFFTYLLYLLIIRFSSESRVKDIVNYFQIFMTVFFSLSFQILPRLIDFTQLSLTFTLKWYIYFFPPVWMALTIEAFSTLNFDSLHLLMILLSFTVPVLTFWFMNKYLAPSFAKKLAAMNVDNSSTKPTGNLEALQTKQPLSASLSAFICTSGTEKAAFEMTWKVTGRDKGFKLQFYPALAYILVFFFIIVFNGSHDFKNTWDQLPGSKNYIWFCYMPLLTVSNCILLVAFNENYAASWVYHSMPVANPGELVSGTMKCLFTKFFLPIFALITCFCVYVWGVEILDDVLFALFNNLFCFLLAAVFSDHYLPFSRQPNTQQQTGRFLKTMVQLIIIAIMVGVHFVIVKFTFPWMLLAILPLLVFGCWQLIKKLQHLPWQKIAV